MYISPRAKNGTHLKEFSFYRATVIFCRSVLFFTLFLCFFSAPLFAFHLGDIDLGISASVHQTYDDNITSRERDKLSDLVTDVSAGLSLAQEGRLRRLELAAGISQELFAQYNEYNQTTAAADLAYEQYVTKHDQIFLQNSFVYTDEGRTFEEAFERETARYSYYRNRFGLDYTKELSKQLHLSARYGNDLYFRTQEGRSDTYTNTAGVDTVYFISSANILFFSYDFSSTNFDPGNDAFIHTLSSGFRHHLSPQLYFDARGGADFINSYNSEDYIRPMWQASLSNDIDRNTSVNMSFFKRYSANTDTQDLFDSWQLSGNFTKQLLERLGFSLSVFYGEGEYKNFNITDKFLGASSGFAYDLTRHINTNLNYSYIDRSSTVDGRAYRRNRITLGVRTEF